MIRKKLVLSEQIGTPEEVYRQIPLFVTQANFSPPASAIMFGKLKSAVLAVVEVDPCQPQREIS